MCERENRSQVQAFKYSKEGDVSHLGGRGTPRAPISKSRKTNLHVPRIVERCPALFIIDDWNDEVHEEGEQKGMSHKQEVGKWGGGVTSAPLTSTEHFEYH